MKFQYTIQTNYPRNWSDMFMKVNATISVRNQFEVKKTKVISFKRLETGGQQFIYEVFVSNEEMERVKRSYEGINTNYQKHLITQTIPFMHKSVGYCECKQWLIGLENRKYIIDNAI